MKQKITVAQVNELDDSQKARLKEWFRTNGPQDSYELTNEDRLPLLNIGQMMELLNDFGESYREVLNQDIDYITDACDALWEAVKRVLTE